MCLLGMGDSRFRTWLVRLGLCAALAAAAPWAQAQVAAALTTNPTWQDLGARNQHILKPLAGHWDQMGLAQKQKWLSLAARYPKLDPEQQERARDRMADWARMTPEQRQRARLNFSQAQDLSRSERQARWQAYQALPEDAKQALAKQWATRRVAGAAGTASGPTARGPAPGLRTPVAVGAAGSNAGPSPRGAKLKAVGLGSVQAPVGATTRPLTEKPRPPSHQRIVTGPEWVHPLTLLPLRGPQAVGVAPRPLPPPSAP